MADRPAKGVTAGRSPVIAQNGMVATSQPLATVAGLQVLAEGGSAVDAAIATAAVLCVVEPPMTGVGGDMFAIVYDSQRDELRGLNGSGRAPTGATPDFFTGLGHKVMPDRGPLTVTVPGAVDGWITLWERYGRLPFARLLAPAIHYASEGFPVSPIVAAQWRRNVGRLRPYQASVEAYLPGGEAPQIGQRVKLPALAETLKAIAEGGRKAFYEGPLAQRIAEAVQREGGLLTAGDMASHHSDWVEPISATYRGYRLYELPPNGQGLAALQMLNMLEADDLTSLGHNSGEYLHRLVEAKKLAFADRDDYLADPAFADIPVEQLLSKEYAAQRRSLINPDQAATQVAPGLEIDGDTVYLTVVDKDRMCVSFIQSIFQPFGSGLVASDTGVLLHNRGSFFSLDPKNPNRIQPGKRPLHTIIPAMAFEGSSPWLSFGVMGGDNQPQAHVQVLANLIDFGMDVQSAGEAARFRHLAGANGGELMIESGIDPDAVLTLLEKGHKVTRALDVFGGYQAVLIDQKNGVLHGGSDPRKDGCALGY